jgi:uncharacterized protein (DUF1330 family)
MAKAYWVVCYRSISNPAARDEYAKLAVPAVLAAGGRFLARGNPAKTYDDGVDQRTVMVPVTVCRDKAGTEESLKIARDWITKNAASTGVGAPYVSEGPVILHLK